MIVKRRKEKKKKKMKENDEENEPAADNRIMARDRQTFVFSATLTVPDEVKYKLDRKKPQASSKKVNNGKKKDGGGGTGVENNNGNDETMYRLEPPKELASTNTMGNLMKMVPFYGRVKLCDVERLGDEKEERQQPR